MENNCSKDFDIIVIFSVCKTRASLCRIWSERRGLKIKDESDFHD